MNYRLNGRSVLASVRNHPRWAAAVAESSPAYRHAWNDLVPHLAAKPEYRVLFKDAFGIEQPTQDALAKAVAA